MHSDYFFLRLFVLFLFCDSWRLFFKLCLSASHECDKYLTSYKIKASDIST